MAGNLPMIALLANDVNVPRETRTCNQSSCSWHDKSLTKIALKVVCDKSLRCIPLGECEQSIHMDCNSMHGLSFYERRIPYPPLGRVPFARPGPRSTSRLVCFQCMDFPHPTKALVEH
eukprot:scaffold324_cov326-Pavlova_lutheri.AAC.5